MDGFQEFMLGHPEFFESISRRVATPEYIDVLANLLPEGWSTHRFDIWLSAHFDGLQLPLQGFKIHVSARPEYALQTIRRVVPVCIAADTSFKMAGDPELYRLLCGKAAARGSSGKFMTIYPRDTETFKTLIAQIAEATVGLEGPYILSDKRYDESRVVFYRYGGILRADVIGDDGISRPSIVGADGEMVSDDRTPYFSLPDWVEDPFPSEPEAEGDTIIGGRFEVKEAFAFTNAGGVYRATDHETGDDVVLKEARPHTSVWVGADGRCLDSVDILTREYEMLVRLAETGVTAAPLSLFKAWEHTFVAQSLVPGIPLRQFRAHESIIITSAVSDPERMQRFCTAFKVVGTNLIDAVEAIHAHGVVLGDLSPNNIMVDPETLSVTIIDLESAHIPDEWSEPLYRVWHTPGFRRDPETMIERPVAPLDDHFAAGMSLSSLVFPAQHFFVKVPASKDRILGRFCQAGLPGEVRDVVDALCRGDVAAARAVLTEWTHVGERPLVWDADWWTV